MKFNKQYNMDCREGLQKLDDESIDCCITSPPYWSLRDYGIEPSIWDDDPECEHEWEYKIKKGISGGTTAESSKNLFARKGKDNYSIVPDSKYAFCSKCGAWLGCLGLEPTFDLFIKHLCDIYDDVKRVLKKSGTCFVNLGDSYSSHNQTQTTPKAYSGRMGDGNGIGRKEVKSEVITTKRNINHSIPSKCLLMIPQRFAIEMINRGWILRNVIIWHKPNCMPSSAKDRFTVDFEYVYFFVKNKKYWFEQQREPITTKYIYSRASNKGGTQAKNNPHSNWGMTRDELKEKGLKEIPNEGRNKRCVWKIPTKPNPAAHFATFPPDLIKPMILSGCPEYICKVCGKPREKIIVKTGGLIGSGKDSTSKTGIHIGVSKTSSLLTKKVQERKVNGYTDCGCGAGFEPGVVLDIFAGTGTTLKTAFELARNYLGFEISKEYCENIAAKFLESTKNKRLSEFM